MKLYFLLLSLFFISACSFPYNVDVAGNFDGALAPWMKSASTVSLSSSPTSDGFSIVVATTDSLVNNEFYIWDVSVNRWKPFKFDESVTSVFTSNKQSQLDIRNQEIVKYLDSDSKMNVLVYSCSSTPRNTCSDRKWQLANIYIDYNPTPVVPNNPPNDPPSIPGNPSIPVVPGNPGNPSIPVVPGNPGNPDNPDNPGNLVPPSNPSYACTGTVPASSTLCSGDSTGLNANTPNSLVSSCTASRKCEYTCNSGFTLNDGLCTAIPTNSNTHSFEMSGANSGRIWVGLRKSGVSTCPNGADAGSYYDRIIDETVAASSLTVTDLAPGEYCWWFQRNSQGSWVGPMVVTIAQSSTPSYVCTGSVPASSTLCSGDSTGLNANTPNSLVPSCTARRKCEYTCTSGFSLSNGRCTATATNRYAHSFEMSGANGGRIWIGLRKSDVLSCPNGADAGSYYDRIIDETVTVSSLTVTDLAAGEYCWWFQRNSQGNWVGPMLVSIPKPSTTAYVCTGAVPSNARLCTGDGSGLNSYVPRIVVSSCTANTKCEYTCNSGYTLQGNNCVLETISGSNSYTFSMPSAASWQLWVGRKKSGVSGCPGNSPESYSYIFDEIVTSRRYTIPHLSSGEYCWWYRTKSTTSSAWSSWSTAQTFSMSASSGASLCTGSIPGNASLCTGDDSNVNEGTARLLVSSCSASRKCEYTCLSGFSFSNRGCVRSISSVGSGTGVKLFEMSTNSDNWWFLWVGRKSSSYAGCPQSGPFTVEFNSWVQVPRYTLTDLASGEYCWWYHTFKNQKNGSWVGPMSFTVS